MNSRKKLSIFIILVITCSCKKVVNINLNDASPQIVIEGIITNNAGPYQVQITKTVNFSDANNFPAVTGATVLITDATISKTDTLFEASPGIYKTHAITGIPGHSYNLKINTGGQKYTSSSTMPLPVPIDSLTFIHSNFGANIINTIPNFQDPKGIPNYYSFTQFVNRKKLKNTFVFDDRLSDGKYIRPQLFTDSTVIKVGDTLTLSMNCIDKNVWSYFNILLQVSTDNRGASITPSNPTSNISNNALGYFSAQAVQTKTKVVPK